ncbi:hypothetical protein GWK47_038633 [Chionoecetes opilio]|nr:hypothetical protein GWK47_038633 [Chionoecetes opilio]
MVLFPVLYGLCQLAEVVVATGLFQAWLFAHRHDVTEEEVTSVVDNSLLTSIPVPAHKLPKAGMEQVAEYSMVPVVCRGPEEASPSPRLQTSRFRHYPGDGEWRAREEIQQPFLPGHLNTQAAGMQWDEWTPAIPPTTPNRFTTHDHDSTTDYPQGDSTDLDPCSDSMLESARSYDSDGPCSPALSNKGVPNMFPVTKSDFQDDFHSDGEDSPLPYGSPIPSCRGRPWDPEAAELQRAGGGSPTSASPASPRSPPSHARPFTFYHRDIRLGQTQQFSTFGRK